MVARTGSWWVALVAVGVLASSSAAAAAQAGKGVNAGRAAERDPGATPDLEWSWRLSPGKMIEIAGVNGEIRAVGTGGDRVEVTARKHAHRSDPDEVTIEVLQHQGGITLCARYPDVQGHHNECAPNGRSHMSTRDNDTQVDFDVRVPAAVRFVGRTVNGDVEGRDLAADAEAHTVNGSVVLETRGRAEATTVNGSLRVRMGRSGREGAVQLTTVNGSITLELPETFDAEVDAHSVNGGIESDFPITVRGFGLGRNRLKGVIGQGGPRLVLSTVNGGIRLRKAGSL